MSGSRRGLAWWVIALVLVVGGGVLLGVGLTSQHHAPQPTAAQAHPSPTTVSVAPTVPSASPGAATTTVPTAPASAGASGGARSSASSPTPTSAAPASPAQPLMLPRSVPVSIKVPSIGVHSSLLQLGLNADHSIQVPPLYEKHSHAGWYKYSPTPGQIGPSVILGHVDSKYGAAVFFKLGALQPGRSIDVTLADRTVAVFTVDKVVSYPKSTFPTDAVYGSIDHAGLRLITCGGTFDSASRSYESNIVAYASLTSSHRASS